MSKASKWSQSDPKTTAGGDRARPVFRWKGTRYALVERNFSARKKPGLYLPHGQVPNVATLSLARWITETFGEAK